MNKIGQLGIIVMIALMGCKTVNESNSAALKSSPILEKGYEDGGQKDGAYTIIYHCQSVDQLDLLREPVLDAFAYADKFADEKSNLIVLLIDERNQTRYLYSPRPLYEDYLSEKMSDDDFLAYVASNDFL
ncbi:hypothetical protein [Spirochaeta cellobiosiphila]|uniref:hypothetical protein n=1 Tax=Spirochaeta cellobiosiphila TaxID=504483 RepID=UPI000429FEA2|nr:hypothetical protein [Spirochaeta cellobiosiphila]